jgi:predicted DNA-binding protein
VTVPTANEEKASLRLPGELLERLKRAQDLVARANAGLEVTASDVLRMAISRGLSSIEKEYSRRV